MIIDALHNSGLYYNLGEKFKKAFEFLQNNDFETMPEGRVDIDGDNVYAIIMKYNTIDPEAGKWEAHREYIDVQYIVYGGEDFGFVNVEYLNPIDEYSPEKDIQFFEGDGDFFQLHEEEFAVLFPDDAHMPKISIEGSEEVLKVVVKIKFEE